MRLSVQSNEVRDLYYLIKFQNVQGGIMESIIMGVIDFLTTRNILVVYLFYFISAFLQVVFPPHPGDVIIIFEGYLTSLPGSFEFFPILLVNLCASILGCYSVFKFGYTKGYKVFEYKLIKKYIARKQQKKVKLLFHRYGYLALFISKFIPGLNIVMILSAGIFKMKPSLVYALVIASLVIHHIAYLLLGRVLGYNMGYIKHLISTYNEIVGVIFVLFIVGFIIYKYLIKKEAKRDKL